MPLLNKSDLQYDYSWTAVEPDDPRITGIPDTTLLNRNEGYEVLAFLNRFAAANDWTSKVPALKAERLIRTHVPGSLRSHAHVWQWLVNNWNTY